MSWGHRLIAIVPTTTTSTAQRGAAIFGGAPRPIAGARCSSGGARGVCAEPATYLASYAYVTGRAGRVSSAEKALCTAHARRFAENHHLEMPPIDTALAQETSR